MIRIVLADDHAMVRAGLRMLLDAEDDLEVVGVAADADGALSAVAEHRPDVAVVDLTMPGRPTLEVVPDLAAGARVVVMTMHADAAFARSALAAGATAFVLKEGAEAELVGAVRAAAVGRTYLDPQLGARMAAPAQTTLRSGDTFAGHRIEAVAGRGGMGVVYRAVHSALDRRVALKVLAAEFSADPAFRERFERECRAAAAIDHPHVVSVFHAGEEAGRLYVSMRYVDGSDLGRMIAAGPLEPERATRLVVQVADALGAAHARDLIHRDVKPGNVLVSGERAFLTDFGITKARELPSDLTATGVAMGTPDYMAPEQARGDPVDERADVYSLACVLYHAIAGHPPFDGGNTVEKLWAHQHQPAPPLHGAAPGIAAAVARALAKDPGERPPSAAAFAAALTAAS